MRSFKKEQLLSDVLREGDYEEFRRAVFEAGKHELKRKRWNARPWLAAAAMLVLGILLGQSLLGDRSAPVQITASPKQEPITTTEETRPFLEVVRSAPLRDSAVVRSVARQSVLVSTDARGLPARMLVRSGGDTETVNDAELLALFPNQPVGFVMSASGERRFVMGSRSLGSESAQMP